MLGGDALRMCSAGVTDRKRRNILGDLEIGDAVDYGTGPELRVRVGDSAHNERVTSFARSSRTARATKAPLHIVAFFQALSAR